MRGSAGIYAPALNTNRHGKLRATLVRVCDAEQTINDRRANLLLSLSGALAGSPDRAPSHRRANHLLWFDSLVGLLRGASSHSERSDVM